MLKDEKILLVDDEKDFIDALSERMVLRGIQVLTASDGHQAIDMVQKESFDCVILDMMMPGIDGLETLQEMLKIDKDLQVLMLTGHGTVQKATAALKLGAMDFLEKPVPIDDLVLHIKEAKMNRMMIVEKKSKNLVEDILKRKGW